MEAPGYLKWAFYLPMYRHSYRLWVSKKCIDKQMESTPPISIDRILSVQVPAYFIDICYFFSSEKWKNKYKLSLWLIYGFFFFHLLDSSQILITASY